MPKRMLFLVALLPLFGCATLLAKKSTAVQMTSTPAGAEVWIDGARAGTTPVTVDLPNNQEHVVVFTMEGRDEVTCRLNRKVSAGWVVLDVLFGIVPLLVDAITGAWNTLDSDMCDVRIADLSTVGNAAY